jgi:hypothetical protein
MELEAKVAKIKRSFEKFFHPIYEGITMLPFIPVAVLGTIALLNSIILACIIRGF